MVSRALPANSFHMYMWVNIGLFLYIYIIYIYIHILPRKGSASLTPLLPPCRAPDGAVRTDHGPVERRVPVGPTRLCCPPRAHPQPMTPVLVPQPLPGAARSQDTPRLEREDTLPRVYFQFVGFLGHRLQWGDVGAHLGAATRGGRDPSAPARVGVPLSGSSSPLLVEPPPCSSMGDQGVSGTRHPHRAPTATGAPGVVGQGCRGWWVCGAIRQLCPGPAHS